MLMTHCELARLAWNSTRRVGKAILMMVESRMIMKTPIITVISTLHFSSRPRWITVSLVGKLTVTSSFSCNGSASCRAASPMPRRNRGNQGVLAGSPNAMRPAALEASGAPGRSSGQGASGLRARGHVVRPAEHARQAGAAGVVHQGQDLVAGLEHRGAVRQDHLAVAQNARDDGVLAERQLFDGLADGLGALVNLLFHQ